jgi:probable HAF family extracellular repeat protein
MVGSLQFFAILTGTGGANMTTYRYKTIDPTGSIYSVSESINSQGQIVGFYQDSNGQEHGFLDSHGIYTTIDPPGSTQAIARAINAEGQIVGTYADDWQRRTRFPRQRWYLHHD